MDLALALSSYSGVSTTILYLLAKLNCFMQRKATDYAEKSNRFQQAACNLGEHPLGAEASEDG